MNKRIFPIIIIMILVAITAAVFYSTHRAAVENRTSQQLWEKYHIQVSNEDTYGQKRTLDLILKQDPSDKKAVYALIYWYTNQGQISEALTFTKKMHQKFSDDPIIAFELAKLYFLVDDNKSAIKILNTLVTTDNIPLRKKAKALLTQHILEKNQSSNQQTDTATKKPLGLSLIDTYEENKYADFNTAKDAITQLIAQHPDNSDYCLKLATIYKIHNQPQQYFKALSSCVEKTPSAELSIALANYYIKNNQSEKAIQLLIKAKNDTRVQKAPINDYLKFIDTMVVKKETQLPNTKQPTNTVVLSTRETHLNHYYNLKQNNQKAAYKYLSQLVRKYPNDYQIQLEMGYTQLKNHRYHASLKYFKRAFLIKPNLMIAKQIGYLYTETKNYSLANNYFHKSLLYAPNDLEILSTIGYNLIKLKKDAHAETYFKKAYHISKKSDYAVQVGYLKLNQNKRRAAYSWFKTAAKTTNKKLKEEVETALYNLAGAQFSFMPYPFFISVYATPFYNSRFNFFVTPIRVQSGFYANKTNDTKIYFTYRRTTDSKSNVSSDRLSQIFEDNIAIYGLGLAFKPFKKIGLHAFLEAGISQDLIPRNRPKYRGDLTTGLYYYTSWGKLRHYSSALQFPLRSYGNLYTDLIYYSRYKNLIGSFRLKHGIHFIQYKNFSTKLYLLFNLTMDSKREFFNNYIEAGTGIKITPYNHIPISIKIEYVNGYYLPIKSISRNPYRPFYSSLNAYLQTDFRF